MVYTKTFRSMAEVCTPKLTPVEGARPVPYLTDTVSDSWARLRLSQAWNSAPGRHIHVVP